MMIDADNRNAKAALLAALKACASHVIVSNKVGLTELWPTTTARRFREGAGAVEQLPPAHEAKICCESRGAPTGFEKGFSPMTTAMVRHGPNP